MDELGNLDQLKDELDGLLSWMMSWVSWIIEGWVVKLEDELRKVDELKDEFDEFLSWRMSWVNWMS